MQCWSILPAPPRLPQLYLHSSHLLSPQSQKQPMRAMCITYPSPAGMTNLEQAPEVGACPGLHASCLRARCLHALAVAEAKPLRARNTTLPILCKAALAPRASPHRHRQNMPSILVRSPNTVCPPLTDSYSAGESVLCQRKQDVVVKLWMQSAPAKCSDAACVCS